MAKRTPDPVETPSEPPGEQELATVLGPARALLDALTGAPGRSAEWRRYSKRSPWVLRVSQGGKPVIYLQPEAGALKATVMLGARAVEAALAGRVGPRLQGAIRGAKVYPEGRPVEVRVKRTSDVTGVEALVAVKLKPGGEGSPGRAPRR
jgi:hypothetical protein